MMLHDPDIVLVTETLDAADLVIQRCGGRRLAGSDVGRVELEGCAPVGVILQRCGVLAAAWQWVQSGAGVVTMTMRPPILEVTRARVCAALAALNAADLPWRPDSGLLRSFIREGKPDLEFIVRTLGEMRFFAEHTDYCAPPAAMGPEKDRLRRQCVADYLARGGDPARVPPRYAATGRGTPRSGGSGVQPSASST